MPPLLKRADAARFLNVSIRTVDELLARGELPACRVGGSIRFREETLSRYVEGLESRIVPRRRCRR